MPSSNFVKSQRQHVGTTRRRDGDRASGISGRNGTRQHTQPVNHRHLSGRAAANRARRTVRPREGDVRCYSVLRTFSATKVRRPHAPKWAPLSLWTADSVRRLHMLVTPLVCMCAASRMDVPSSASGACVARRCSAISCLITWKELESARQTLGADLRWLGTAVSLQHERCRAQRTALNNGAAVWPQSWFEGPSITRTGMWTDEMEATWREFEGTESGLPIDNGLTVTRSYPRRDDLPIDDGLTVMRSFPRRDDAEDSAGARLRLAEEDWSRF